MNGRRKTKEEFVKEVYELVGNEYEVLGDYINNYTKILMRHNICKHEYEVIPNGFLSGARCPECVKKRITNSKIKQSDIFMEEVFNLVGNEYTVLGEYENSMTKILIKHNKCGHEWNIIPSSFLRGTRCPNCVINRGRRKTQEEFEKEVYDLVGDEYTVLGEYINTRTPIKIRHNVCGNIMTVAPVSFKKNSRCSYCTKHNALDSENFKRKIHKLVGDEYTVLGEYINSYTKILMRHNKCGHEWMVRGTSFINVSTRCPVCSNLGKITTARKTQEQFEEEVYNLFGNEYTILGEYIGSKENILIRHNTCGKEYITKGEYLLKGYGLCNEKECRRIRNS